MTAPQAPIAVFDFDGTMTHGDTLLPFLRYYAGDWAFFWKISQCLPRLVLMKMGLTNNEATKNHVLKAFFCGAEHSKLVKLGHQFAQEILPKKINPELKNILDWHTQKGHCCYLVSASLDLYLEPWCKQAGFSGLICSRLATDAYGNTPGVLDGANVYGPEKARQLIKILGDQPKIIYAYGDSRGDREMLELSVHAWYRGRWLSATPAGWMD